MKAETRKVLDDLKRAGLDTSSIENQMRANPLVDKQADFVLGDGILRQSEYTRYMNQAVQEKRELEARVQQLATMHDASKTTQLPKEALDTIATLEQELINTGLFDEQSVREVSYRGKKPLMELVNQPNPNPPAPAPPQQPQQRNMNMPNPDLEKNYVDMDTHTTSMANLAYGSIATNMQIAAKIDEVKALGIPVTATDVERLTEELRRDFSTGQGNMDRVFNNVFKVQEVKAAKEKEVRDKELSDARAAGKAEGLKEAGVPGRKVLKGSGSPLFQKRSAANQIPENTQVKNPYTDEQGNIDPSKLPRNKYGDLERFKLRRSKEERLAGAADAYNEIMERAEQDPLFADVI